MVLSQRDILCHQTHYLSTLDRDTIYIIENMVVRDLRHRKFRRWNVRNIINRRDARILLLAMFICTTYYSVSI